MQCILERYYKQLRASGNGAAGKAMAIPGFEGEKMEFQSMQDSCMKR